MMLGQEKVIDQSGLASYILACQDNKQGGISDKPGNQQDVFHTFFGIAAMSLLPTRHQELLLPIQPVYALPDHIIRKEFPHLIESSVCLEKGVNM